MIYEDLNVLYISKAIFYLLKTGDCRVQRLGLVAPEGLGFRPKSKTELGLGFWV